MEPRESGAIHDYHRVVRDNGAVDAACTVNDTDTVGSVASLDTVLTSLSFRRSDMASGRVSNEKFGRSPEPDLVRR